ncbi:hypothetical protein E0I74_20335 [Rhizobium laguerreae]|jgi:hypothetical protein|nr:hypothetical protein [Rhizobium laguerreae]NKM83412.1 hypothetical protein [Rhizobium laguerreae]TBX77253.1 hypothetical protein E0I74_20335 [Rhizobium laguerreae]TBY08745.1 hypothetical protein E0I94_17760 [Rhizobium laguerreae]
MLRAVRLSNSRRSLFLGGTGWLRFARAADQKRSPAETGQSGKDGSYRKEGMADGPGIGATCTILMSKQRLVEKVPVRFRTNAWINLYLLDDC